MSDDDVRALFDRYVRALNTRDFGVASAVVAPELTHNGERMTVRRWWDELVMANVACVEGYTWTVDELVVAGDRVTVRYTDTGTLVRPWVGLTRLGRPVSFREYVLYTVSAGRIVEIWSVFDHWALVDPGTT